MTKEQELWWQELGNRIGDGSLERDYPNSVTSLKSQYYKRMFEVTQVKPVNKKQQPEEEEEEEVPF